MKTVSQEGTFNDMLEDTPPEIQQIAIRLRTLIDSLHAEAVEVIWLRQRIAGYGVGPKKMSEQYSYIAPFKKHVNLGFYYGAALPDPEGLLEGTGKSLRHVKVRSVDGVDQQAVVDLIQAAIAERITALGN